MTSLESRIGDLLADLSGVQDELLAVLTLKRERMVANDVDGMVALQDRERELGTRLEACHTRRTDLLHEAAGQGLPGDSLGNLAAAVTHSRHSPLGKQVRETSSRTRLLRHHSLTNWVLAQRTLLHLAHMLEILATGGRLLPTYSSGTNAPNTHGALLDQDA